MIQQRPNETDEEYEKRKRRVKLTMMGGLANGGGSIIAAAAIYYQDNGGNFLYIPDGSGNLVLDNKGSLGPTYDGLLYSGRGIELGATNDVDIPIHHTLGAETITDITGKISGDEVSTFTKTSSSSYDLAVTTIGTNTIRPYVTMSGTYVVGNTYKLELDVVINSGTTTFRYSTGGGTFPATPITLVNGINTVEFVATGTTADGILFNGTNLFDISVTVSVKQITNPNSYLTYYDFTDGLVTLGNSVDGGSSDSADIYSGTLTAVATSIVLSGITDGYNFVCDGLSGTGAIRVNATITFNGEYSSFIFYASNIIGTPKILSYYDGVNTVTLNHTITSGKNELIIKGRVATTFLSLTFVTNVTYSFDMTAIQSLMLMPISTKYTLNTKTINNVITHTTPWSALDWSKINNNPNLVGKLALETLGATKTIAELDMELDQGASADSYYMCSEKSGAYLVDSRVAYGAEKTVNGDFITDTDWTKGTGWTISGGTANCDGTQIAATNLNNTSNPLTAGILYVATYEITSYSAGSIYIRIGAAGNGQSRTSVGTYTELIKATNTELLFTASIDFIGSIDNVSVREATATEIANYASTVRTNADLQQKGIQQTAFVTDWAGVPTSYSSDLLQFNGDGRYVDTGWIPSAGETYTIEIVQNFLNDAQYHFNGCGISSIAGRTKVLGENLNGTSRMIWHGVSILGSSALTGIHHLVGVVTPTSISFYEDGVLVNSSVVTETIEGYSFWIGGLNDEGVSLDSRKAYTYEGGFRLHNNKALTASEVATAYAKAKTIYPTLP